MGTWPFGSFVRPKMQIVNRLTGGCGVLCVMCLLLVGGVIVQRLEHGYAVDKRYINAIFTFTQMTRQQPLIAPFI